MQNKLRISWTISSIVYISVLIFFGDQIDENIFYLVLVLGTGLFFWGGLLFFIQKAIFGKKKPLVYSRIKLTEQDNPFSEKILNFLDENPLSIGTLDEFKKGREDFSNWGDGVLTGSKEWVVNKLCNKLSEIGVSNPPSIRRSQNYEWQTSNLEGFTARIEASIPNMLAGYYIGRIGDNLYGLFGCNFNNNETESPTSPAVKSIKLTEQDDAARGVSVLLVALRWDSNPISKQELRDRAARAVQVVDGQFDKDVMDVKILVIDESQQYVQLSVRADFRDKDEEERMRESLKKEFIK